MIALKDFSYQLVTITLRFIAEVLGLGQVAAVRRPAGRRTVSTLLRLSLALAASR
jgi:hypothetical protein